MPHIGPYVQIARLDHWFKNVFCIPGIILAYSFSGKTVSLFDIWDITIGLAATCIAASANYTINEILDAPTDREHPTKRFRPVPSGKIRIQLALAQYVVLGATATAVAWSINRLFLTAILTLLLMGIAYNVPPLRTKDLSFLDTLSEAVNNPIRLVLGWSIVEATLFPPLSILLAYWMVGAYFMSLKRFAEYRHLHDPEIASRYRKSFRGISELKLLTASVVYCNSFCLMLGIFLAKFRLELILSIPFIALVLALYLHLAFKANSPVQFPEKLYLERPLMISLAVTSAFVVICLFVDVPWLYHIFRFPAPPLGR